MTKIETVCKFLDTFAPPDLAEDWDNVGLLVGDTQMPVTRIMTCLTVTPTSAAEAINKRADLIVSHHPMPFRPIKRLTTADTVGQLLLSLAANRVALYSPHTAFDSATQGINQQLAAGLGLRKISPLIESTDLGPNLGTGRRGCTIAPIVLGQLADRVKTFLCIDHVLACGESSHDATNVAVACGSAGQFLHDAKRVGCQVLVTGETTFHTCLEAEAIGMGLVLVGHYASERFAVERLAKILAREFDEIDSWASTEEHDPLRLV